MGAVDAAAAAAAIAHSVSRRETCTSRAASLGPPLVCAAWPRISAARGPWRIQGAAVRDIWPTTARVVPAASGIPLDAARSGDARRYVSGGRPLPERRDLACDGASMDGPWTRGTVDPARPDPGHGTRHGFVPDPRTADGGEDAGPRSGKMCFGTLNSVTLEQ